MSTDAETPKTGADFSVDDDFLLAQCEPKVKAYMRDATYCIEEMKREIQDLRNERRELKAQIFDLTFRDSGLNPFRGEEEAPF